jgi:prolyl-tRNA editing enzyme YbaK/EbsC (Cys-tRNA(Pro) deacylase)
MKTSVSRVEAALRERGISVTIIEFPESTRTAEEAARAVGTTVERIVKSLVFMAGDAPVLTLVSGANRVDLSRLSTILGAAVRRANADEVRAATGFAIGGVAPLGHTSALPVMLDADLLLFDRVYAAAGTPYAVFPIEPATLQQITGARVLDIKEQRL